MTRQICQYERLAIGAIGRDQRIAPGALKRFIFSQDRKTAPSLVFSRSPDGHRSAFPALLERQSYSRGALCALATILPMASEKSS